MAALGAEGMVAFAGAPAMADASGFDRHTFLCGQSGSGKTYSLGVILERLLIETDLRMVVLDPNATPLLAFRNDRSRSIRETLAVLSTLGDDRAIRATYVAGKLAHSRHQVDP